MLKLVYGCLAFSLIAVRMILIVCRREQRPGLPRHDQLDGHAIEQGAKILDADATARSRRPATASVSGVPTATATKLW